MYPRNFLKQLRLLPKNCDYLGKYLHSAAHLGHHHTTITRWIERSGHHSERLHERLFQRALTIGHLQLDELVTKVKKDAECIWVWTAVAAQSKLILALHISRRSSTDAHQLLHQVWQRLIPDSLPKFTSDGLNQYFYGIAAHCTATVRKG